MALRQCDKCSEMVDEAKAFCPGCGNAFVEEEMPKTTAFQKMDNTIQFGQTMYNQMLEDMGLNITDAPNKIETRIEVIKPIKTEITVSPVRANEKPQEKIADKLTSPSNLKWYVLGGLAFIILLPAALASAIMFVLDILSRLR